MDRTKSFDLPLEDYAPAVPATAASSGTARLPVTVTAWADGCFVSDWIPAVSLSTMNSNDGFPHEVAQGYG